MAHIFRIKSAIFKTLKSKKIPITGVETLELSDNTPIMKHLEEEYLEDSKPNDEHIVYELPPNVLQEAIAFNAKKLWKAGNWGGGKHIKSCFLPFFYCSFDIYLS